MFICQNQLISYVKLKQNVVEIRTVYSQNTLTQHDNIINEALSFKMYHNEIKQYNTYRYTGVVLRKYNWDLLSILSTMCLKITDYNHLQ